MKLYRIAAVLMILATFFTTAAAQRGQKSFADGEILVKFRKGVSAKQVSDVNRAFGASLSERLGDLGWMRIAIPAGMTVDQAVESFRERDEIEFAQPNFFYRIAATPNDPDFSNAGMYGLTRISAPAAWDLSTGSSSVVVANIDTGMRYTHADLTANTWTNPGEINGNSIDDDGNGFVDDFYGYDFRYNDSDPFDEHGHGTHTSGTIGATGNNAIGITGVSWSVKIMTIKIYSAAATDSTSAMLVNAYNYIRLMKNRGVNIKATNNSYGDCPEACGYDQATKDALDALGEAGVLNVFAAGNNGRNIDTGAPHYPGSYNNPGILTVASSTSTDARSSFSNFGTTSVDVAAPGSSIYSTTFGTNTSYGNSSGTSMAAPQVTGAAALLAAHRPDLSAASIKATLLNTVDPLAAWSGVVKTGGRLNVFRALSEPTVCQFNLSQNDVTMPTKGGILNINVTVPANCDYTVKSAVPWITLTSQSLLSGNGAISVRVSTNQRISRVGTVRIGDTQLTIRQSRN